MGWRGWCGEVEGWGGGATCRRLQIEVALRAEAALFRGVAGEHAWRCAPAFCDVAYWKAADEGGCLVSVGRKGRPLSICLLVALLLPIGAPLE